MDPEQSFQTSRILNEVPTYAGLDQNDLMAILIGSMSLFMVLAPFGYEFFSPVVVLLGVLLLIPIRLKYRRRFIRDSLRFHLIKKFNAGVIYDPTNFRHYRK